jgi:hypothetical protein
MQDHQVAINASDGTFLYTETQALLTPESGDPP